MVDHGPSRCLGVEIYCLAVMQIRISGCKSDSSRHPSNPVRSLPGIRPLFFTATRHAGDARNGVATASEGAASSEVVSIPAFPHRQRHLASRGRGPRRRCSRPRSSCVPWPQLLFVFILVGPVFAAVRWSTQEVAVFAGWLRIRQPQPATCLILLPMSDCPIDLLFTDQRW